MVFDINSVEFNSIVSQCKTIFDEISVMIPNYIFGIDKLNYCKETLDGLSEENKQVLRSFFDSILFEMHKIEASDLDFGGYGCSNRFWMRIQGIKKPYELLPEFNINEANILILNVLSEKQIEYLFENRNLDFSYTVKIEDVYSKEFRFRADAYFELDNLSINIRAILSSIRPFESLNFHPNVAKVMNINYMKEGLILITGITGSGKSSTLDSIIDENNKTSHSHIIIISSPVEYIHTSKRCVIKHREVGRDVHSFKEGTVQALRQDPDIIVIGELRDSDTIIAALDVTDSGHKVFSTLHTSSAVETIDRIIGETDVHEQDRVRQRLADVIKCIVSQKLLPGVDGKLVLAKEVLLITPSVKAAIKNNNTGEIYQMIHQANDIGMHTMEQDLARLFKQRKITYDNAVSFANQKNRIQQLLSGLG